MQYLMDALEKKIVKIITETQGKVITENLRRDLQRQVQEALNDFCYAINKNAPKPILVFQFDREAGSNELHLLVDFLHPYTKEEITLEAWQDEFEDGVTH